MNKKKKKNASSHSIDMVKYDKNTFVMGVNVNGGSSIH